MSRFKFKSKNLLFFENFHKKLYLYLYYTHTDTFSIDFPRNFLDRFNEIDKKYDFYIQFEYNNYRKKRNIYKTTTKGRRIETIWTVAESLVCEGVLHIFQTLRSRRFHTSLFIINIAIYHRFNLFFLYIIEITIESHVILQ